MCNGLKDKVALVTGGSRGIGSEICKHLAEHGVHVFVNYTSNATAAEEVVSACKEHGVNSWALQFDVSSEDQVKDSFAKIKEEAGQLDILVNNAGIVIDGLFLRYNSADWHKVLEVNLFGAFLCAQQASKLMVKQRKGRIINISSVVGEMGNAGQVAYSSSKAGLIGMTKTLAREIASRNITVNAITPGFIATEMTEELQEETKAEHMKAIPLARYGDTSDIANAVCFLASDRSSYITGQVLGVNGGMYM